MCGRFTQAYTWQEVYDFYNLAGSPQNLKPNYNVAPTQTVNVIVACASGLELQNMRWGLAPVWWPKPLKELPSTFNARSETVHEKRMFLHAFRNHRCLVSASGFFEWKRHRQKKQPYYIYRTDGFPLTFAGLWSPWHDNASGDDIFTFTILTTRPNRFMENLHNRMPVILESEQFDGWLRDGDCDLLKPCNEGLLTAHPVDKKVGNVRNNGPELLEELE